MSHSPWTQLSERFDRFGSRPALVGRDTEEISYLRLLELAEERGGLLRDRLAGRHSDSARVRLGICSTESLDVLLTVLGAWQAGMIPLIIREQTPEHVASGICAAAGSSDLYINGAWRPIEPRDATRPAVNEAMVLTTSGTSGQPKLVALPDTSPLYNLRSIAEDLGLSPEDDLLVAQPLSHVYGLLGGALAGLWAGARVHVLPATTPAPVVQKYVRNNAISVIQGAPSMWRFLLAFWSGTALDSVRMWTTASEAPGRRLIEQISEMLPNASGLLGYGMTEAGPRVSHVDVAESIVDDGCVGQPFPHLEWKLVDIDPATGIGRLALSGPSMFLGYIGSGEGYEGYEEDGYHYSTDLMAVDQEGRIYHKGRSDQRIKVGGHLVNPGVVEQLLLAQPQIYDARCYPVEHRIMGHVLQAEIIPAEGNAVEQATLLSLCRENLEPSLVPRKINVVSDIARTASGKRQRQPATDSSS